MFGWWVGLAAGGGFPKGRRPPLGTLQSTGLCVSERWPLEWLSAPTRRVTLGQSYQPDTSAIVWTLPVGLDTLIVPPAPTFTVTALGMVYPADQLRLDTLGWACPAGEIDKNHAAVVPVTVTLGTTAFAPDGTPPMPATCSFSNRLRVARLHAKPPQTVRKPYQTVLRFGTV